MRNPILAALGGLLLATAARAQSFDELMPDSTVLYVSVENWARTQERFDASPLNALWGDDEVQAFLERPLAAWRKLKEKLQEEEGIALDEILEVIGGQVAVGLGGTEEQPQITLLADVGGHEEALAGLLQRLDRRMVEKEGRTREEEDFRGTSVVSYRGEEEDDVTYLCVAGRTLLVSNHQERLHEVLARREGLGEPGLAARPVYQRVRERLGARGDLLVYVDGENLTRLLQGDEMSESDLEAWRIADALGVTAIEGLGLQASLRPDRLELKVRLPIRGEMTGVLKLFAGKNGALQMPRFVPPDADGAGVLKLDVPGLYEEARRVAEKIEEGTAARFDAFFEQLKGEIGVDVPGDVIGSMGDEVAYYVKLPQEAGAGGGGNPFERMPDFVLSFSLANQPKFQEAFGTLLLAAGPAVVPDEYLGLKLWTVPTPFGIAPAFAVLPDRFVLGFKVESVKEVISRQGKDVKSVADLPEYAAALEELPAERFSVSISNQARGLRQNFLMTGMQAGIGLAIDLERFPTMETLEKYLGVGVSWATNDEQGVTMVSVAHLKRQPEKTDDE